LVVARRGGRAALAIFPPGQTENQVNQQNSADFTQSQDNAIAAALCELKYPQAFGIFKVVANGPSVACFARVINCWRWRHEVASFDELRAVLALHPPGSSVIVARQARRQDPRRARQARQADRQGDQRRLSRISADNTCLAPSPSRSA